MELYLKEIGKLPKLSDAELLEIAETIERMRGELRRVLGGVPHAVRRLLAFEEKMRNGETSPEAVAILPEAGNKANEVKSVLARLARIRKLDDEITPFQPHLLERCGSPAACSRLHARITRKLAAIQRIVSGLPIRAGLVDELVGVLRCLNDEIEQVKAGPLGERELRGRLEALERQIGLPYKEFQRLMAEIARTERKLKEAKRAWVEANLSLVVSVAQRYRRYLNGDISPLDLIQEGNIGLMQAVDRFEFRLGTKFSSYAIWWVRQAITRALIEHAGVIRIPACAAKRRNRLWHASRSLVGELGREPTSEELFQRTGIRGGHLNGFSSYPLKAVSLQTPTGEDSELVDCLEDEQAPSPSETALARDVGCQVTRALNTLSETEQKILRLRFGIDPEGEHSLKEIASRFSISSERIRQIEAKALEKLRSILRVEFPKIQEAMIFFSPSRSSEPAKT